MKYRGLMKTAFLNDQQIQPTEYRRWADAVARFERRDKDRRLVEELKASIPRDGLKVPIILGIDDRYLDVYVAEGHHRAVALMQLGVHMESELFPYHLLDSTRAA